MVEKRMYRKFYDESRFFFLDSYIVYQFYFALVYCTEMFGSIASAAYMIVCVNVVEPLCIYSISFSQIIVSIIVIVVK